MSRRLDYVLQQAGLFCLVTKITDCSTFGRGGHGRHLHAFARIAKNASRANLRISAGIVAENSSVCRFGERRRSGECLG